MRRLVRRSLKLANFITVQTAAQAFGLLAGFLVIRALDKENYALYTLTNSATSAFAMACNGGIVAASISIASVGWEDARHLGQVLSSANRVRIRLSRLSALPGAAILGWMLLRNDAGLLEAGILLFCAWFAAHYQIRAEILRVALRIRGALGQLQTLDLGGSILRAALSCVLFAFARADFALFVSAVIAAFVFAWTRRGAATGAVLDSPADPEMEARMWLIVRRQLPNDLAYIFQGQIVLLLLTFLGQSEAVADFGALGRIAAVFGILGTVLSSIVLPRYARCHTPGELGYLYFAMMAGYAFVVALPVAATVVVPNLLLWVLGARYAGLDHMLFLVTLNAATMSIGFLAWGANSVRGWIIPPLVNITLMYGSQFILILLIGVDSVEKALWIGILWSLVSIASSIVATLMFSRGFRRA
jgi:hypothetical protein